MQTFMQKLKQNSIVFHIRPVRFWTLSNQSLKSLAFLFELNHLKSECQTLHTIETCILKMANRLVWYLLWFVLFVCFWDGSNRKYIEREIWWERLGTQMDTVKRATWKHFVASFFSFLLFLLTFDGICHKHSTRNGKT